MVAKPGEKIIARPLKYEEYQTLGRKRNS